MKIDNERKGIFGGIIFIAIGIVFLLNNFNLLPWSVWSILWRFWPLFLILGGLEMILGDNWLAKLIVGLITLMIVGYILIQAIAINNSSFKQWLQSNMKWLPLNEQLFQTPQNRLCYQFFNDSNSL